MINSRSFSVIMCVRDLPSSLVGAAAKSTLNQSFKGHIELIICDDGSSPTFERELNLLMAACTPTPNRRVRVTRSQFSKGIPAARNKACALADGDVFVFLDGDDVLPHNALEALARAQASGVSLAIGQTRVQYSHSTRTHLTEPYIAGWKQLRGTLDDPFGQVVFPTHGAAFSREIFEACGGYDEDYAFAEQTDLFLRAASKLEPRALRVIPETTYFYLTRPGSHSSNAAALETYRRKALTEYMERAGTPVDDVFLLGRSGLTGALHYGLIHEGLTHRSSYAKTNWGNFSVTDGPRAHLE